MIRLQKRISISINPHIKKQLEQLAKSNYRTLNGEINKALGFYILSQADAAVMQKEIFTTHTRNMKPSIQLQTEADPHPSVAIYTNNNQYDEVEEF